MQRLDAKSKIGVVSPYAVCSSETLDTDEVHFHDQNFLFRKNWVCTALKIRSRRCAITLIANHSHTVFPYYSIRISRAGRKALRWDWRKVWNEDPISRELLAVYQGLTMASPLPDNLHGSNIRLKCVQNLLTSLRLRLLLLLNLTQLVPTSLCLGLAFLLGCGAVTILRNYVPKKAL